MPYSIPLAERLPHKSLLHINAFVQGIVLLFFLVAVAGLWQDLRLSFLLIPIALATWGLLKRARWFTLLYDVVVTAYALLISGVSYAYRYSSAPGEWIPVLVVLIAALSACASTIYGWKALK